MTIVFIAVRKNIFFLVSYRQCRRVQGAESVVISNVLRWSCQQISANLTQNIQDGGEVMSIYDIRSETTGITSNVKRIIEEKKISIVALSNETKLSTKIIERARTSKIKLCKLETLAIIAKGLDVKIIDLFNE